MKLYAILVATVLSGCANTHQTEQHFSSLNGVKVLSADAKQDACLLDKQAYTINGHNQALSNTNKSNQC
ncbi:hypothetical protein [Thalassotalea aquiviva]|uniref:hypothetical protein n=1 Tax=Thalassotalea aquiviva TaxID=3242415 RepID=UPI00352B0C73